MGPQQYTLALQLLVLPLCPGRLQPAPEDVLEAPRVQGQGCDLTQQRHHVHDERRYVPPTEQRAPRGLAPRPASGASMAGANS